MMECVRCGGLAVMQYIDDLHDTYAWIEVSRCLNCGHIEDVVIHARRTFPDRDIPYGRRR